jgi:hypothetical protein
MNVLILKFRSRERSCGDCRYRIPALRRRKWLSSIECQKAGRHHLVTIRDTKSAPPRHSFIQFPPLCIDWPDYLPAGRISRALRRYDQHFIEVTTTHQHEFTPPLTVLPPPEAQLFRVHEPGATSPLLTPVLSLMLITTPACRFELSPIRI